MRDDGMKRLIHVISIIDCSDLTYLHEDITNKKVVCSFQEYVLRKHLMVEVSYKKMMMNGEMILNGDNLDCQNSFFISILRNIERDGRTLFISFPPQNPNNIFYFLDFRIISLLLLS